MEKAALHLEIDKILNGKVPFNVEDLYKTHGAPIEFKGTDCRGNERYGYVYSPELFIVSSKTNRQCRYIVWLDENTAVHPASIWDKGSTAKASSLHKDQEYRKNTSIEKQVKRAKNKIELAIYNISYIDIDSEKEANSFNKEFSKIKSFSERYFELTEKKVLLSSFYTSIISEEISRRGLENSELKYLNLN